MSKTELQSSLDHYAMMMKRDWNQRASENARWFINTYKVEQSDEEFEASCHNDVAVFIQSDLPILTWGKEARSLKLLEIGCGIGRMTRKLAEIFGEVHGADVSGEMIAQARSRLAELPNVFFHETSGVDFREFDDAVFDVIFSAYVFQHVPTTDIIRANLRDAWRVLKPGGVFKFMASGITSEDYARMEKSTWTGAPFIEADSRAIALELGAQLINVMGAGTQYFWTTLRKPLPAENNPLSSLPKILKAGRADDLNCADIPSQGHEAYLGLQLTGLPLSQADCNRLVIEYGSRDLLPMYAGPAGERSAEVSELMQINVPVPSDTACGAIEIRLRMPTGVKSNSVTVNVLPPATLAPVIVHCSNAFDEGLDIYASGLKSVVRVFAQGMDDSATIDNVRVHIDKLELAPLDVSFIPANGMWMIIVQLPTEIKSQKTEICLCQKGQLSLPFSVSILPSHSL